MMANDERRMTFPAGGSSCPDCGGLLNKGVWCPARNSVGPEIGARYYCMDCGQCWGLGAELMARIDVPECRVCPLRREWDAAAEGNATPEE